MTKDEVGAGMTREERELSITYLEGIKDEYIEGEGYERHPLPEYYAIETAIKVLAQEPVIDKIRAEIEQLRLHKAQFLTNDNKVCIDSQEVLDIIDKYTEKSEEQMEEDADKDADKNFLQNFVYKDKENGEKVMNNTQEKIFKLYIRSAFNQFEKYYLRGTKENLMALIGCLYSTRFEKIERISYEEVKEIPKDIQEIKYHISNTGDIRISYKSPVIELEDSDATMDELSEIE